jgi:hypothetical protein
VRGGQRGQNGRDGQAAPFAVGSRRRSASGPARTAPRAWP